MGDVGGKNKTRSLATVFTLITELEAESMSDSQFVQLIVNDNLVCVRHWTRRSKKALPADEASRRV